MDFSQIITDIFKEWAPFVLAVIGVFSAIATLVPAPGADSGRAYRVFYSVLSWTAMNFGYAKNTNVAQAASKKNADSATGMNE